MSNNFDTCSYGIGVCVNVHYSNWCSQMRFEDNFKCLVRDRRGDGHAYFYIDWGNISVPPTVGDLIQISNLVDGKIPDVESLLRLGEVLNYCDGNWWYSDSELTEKWEENPDEFGQEIIDEILGLDIEHIEDVLQYACCELKQGVTTYTTRGYCQGDVATVYIDWNLLNEIWGRDIKFTSDNMCGLTLSDRETIRSLENDIDHYFWDAPIDGCVTLTYRGDEIELYASEHLEDEYAWDEEYFISEIMAEARAKFKDLDERLFTVLKQDLTRLLPENPDYY
jgi:hypothetical protein